MAHPQVPYVKCKGRFAYPLIPTCVDSRAHRVTGPLELLGAWDSAMRANRE